MLRSPDRIKYIPEFLAQSNNLTNEHVDAMWNAAMSSSHEVIRHSVYSLITSVQKKFTVAQLFKLHGKLSDLPASQFDTEGRLLLREFTKCAYGLFTEDEAPLGVDIMWRIIQDENADDSGGSSVEEAMHSLSITIQSVMLEDSDFMEIMHSNLERLHNPNKTEGGNSAATDMNSYVVELTEPNNPLNPMNRVRKWIQNKVMDSLSHDRSVIQSLNILHAIIVPAQNFSYNGRDQHTIPPHYHAHALKTFWECDVFNVVANSVVKYFENGKPKSRFFNSERDLSDRMSFLVSTMAIVMTYHSEPAMGVDVDGVTLRPNRLEYILRSEVLKKVRRRVY